MPRCAALRGFAWALASLAFAAAPAPARGDASVAGRVALPFEGASLKDLGPIVIFLEPLGAAGAPPPPAPASIHQHAARFSPGFLAVAAGQPVEMANDDAIYHNVFSYSKPNHFDLGLYPAGESRSVRFRHPGVVKIYCSIHDSMNGTVFVSPSPYFARVSTAGSFEIEGVPPGRYRLRSWCEKLPEVSRELRLEDGRRVELELPLGAGTAPASPAP